jgi:hypothetical protein
MRQVGKTIFVVIEPDPTKRDGIAAELQRLSPLQILFFESSRHARAFLAAVPIGPGIKVEVGPRAAARCAFSPLKRQGAV